MGFFGKAADRVRNWMRTDKAAASIQFAKGATSAGAPAQGYDLLQAYGYDVVSDYLKLEHDLLSRFVDYEEMDDYPELACITKESSIPAMVLPSNSCDINSELLERKNISVGELVEARKRGEIDRFFVFAFDHEEGRVKVAEAKGPVKTGRRKVYRITYESFRREFTWSIKATGDHLFMLRDGEYRRVDELRPGNRMMPCTVRVGPTGYSEVYEPVKKTKTGKATYKYVHQLVAQAVIGRDFENSEVVHHINRDKTDYRPENLKVTTLREHVADHWDYPGTHEEHVKKISEGTRKKWADPHFKLRVSKAQQSAKPAWLDDEKAGKHKAFQASGKLSDAHRAAISKGRTIPLAKDVVEAAMRASSSLNDASKKLDVSWNTLVRRIDSFGIDRAILGSNLGGPQPGDSDYGNHRVVSVEYVGEEDVYDIEVPGYHNFAVGDAAGGGEIFIHNSAIDIYADDCTQTDMQINRSLWLSSPDKDVEKLGSDLFHKTLRIDEELWEVARTLCKYGNDYEELLVNGRTGYSPAEMQQILAARATTQSGGSVRDDKITALEDWEVVHFRLRGKHRRSIYGYSALEPARWIWKRLMLLEDAALIYRLQRAPERYAFYVDVGDLPPREAMAYVNKVRQQFKKKKFVNPSTGKLDLKWEPLSQDEDFFIPTRKGADSTRIEVVGSPSWQHMDDIEYFQKKLFSAMKVPKAYLGQEEGVARAVLSSEDTRFARTMLRVQRELRNGFSKVFRTHMAAIGIDPTRVEYEIHMTTPSSIFELAQLEVRNARADLASRMREHVSLHWVLANVFGMGDKEIETIIEQREEDTIRDMAAEGKGQAEAQKALPPEPGFGAGAPPPVRAPAPPAAKAPPAGEMATGEEARQSMRKLYSAMSRQRRSSKSLLGRGARGISEQELFRGSREAEKRASDKLDEVLRGNRVLGGRMKEAQGLLRELARANMKG